MLYAQFYQKSVISDEIIEACSDRAVIILDGRYNLSDNKIIARLHCEKRGFLGFRIFKGENFSRSNAITEYEVVK